MTFEKCINLIQSYLQNSPLIVLGSGASMSYGLPSMGMLAIEICKHRDNIEDEGIHRFYTFLKESMGLEDAIDKSNLKPETISRIRRITWEFINSKDIELIKNEGINESFAIAKLFTKVIQPTPNTVQVVTTNYDRLAEYAADIIDATVVTGFEGSLIKKLELPLNSVIQKRVYVRERVVNIWKVHGSLDWFSSPNDDIRSFPLTTEIPTGWEPLIIPPGKEKYNLTHKEPYRTMIAQADNAFLGAESFLCIGYGFNDEHIQPKLLAEAKKGKPIVILVKKMSDACIRHIVEAKIKNYLILEEGKNNHTTVYCNGIIDTYDKCFWNLEGLLEFW